VVQVNRRTLTLVKMPNYVYADRPFPSLNGSTASSIISNFQGVVKVRCGAFWPKADRHNVIMDDRHNQPMADSASS
jgi:hypothetical protein